MGFSCHQNFYRCSCALNSIEHSGGLHKLCQCSCCVYVAEARLERIKGKGSSSSSRVTSKDMIKGLNDIRTAQLHAASVGADSSLPYLRNCEYIADSMSAASSVVDTVLRRIAPEKQAVNEEELRSLIENDELRDKTVELYAAENANESTHATSVT